MAPGHSEVFKAAEPPALSSQLSVERIRELVGQEVNWFSVYLDAALTLLEGVVMENLDQVGHVVLDGSPVWGYIDTTYPALLSLLARIASGEITEEMLKEDTRSITLLRPEDLVRFGP